MWDWLNGRFSLLYLWLVIKHRREFTSLQLFLIYTTVNCKRLLGSLKNLMLEKLILVFWSWDLVVENVWSYWARTWQFFFLFRSRESFSFLKTYKGKCVWRILTGRFCRNLFSYCCGHLLPFGRFDPSRTFFYISIVLTSILD